MYIPYQGKCGRSLTGIEWKPLLSRVESEKQGWGNLGRPRRFKVVPGFYTFAFLVNKRGPLYTQGRTTTECSRADHAVGWSRSTRIYVRPVMKLDDQVKAEALKRICNGGLREAEREIAGMVTGFL